MTRAVDSRSPRGLAVAPEPRAPGLRLSTARLHNPPPNA